MPTSTHRHEVYSRDATVHLLTAGKKFDTFRQAVAQAGFVSHLLDRWAEHFRRVLPVQPVNVADILGRGDGRAVPPGERLAVAPGAFRTDQPVGRMGGGKAVRAR